MNNQNLSISLLKSEPIIRLENINFYYNYGKTNQFQALKNINLEIKQGEQVGILGPSGCGKTTLLHLIAGIENPQEGKVIVLGKEISRYKLEDLAFYRQIGVGIVFQNFNLIPSITVMENITLPMAFLGISDSKRKERAIYLLKRLNIENLANRYPSELSGGQQQRVGIARALANDPPIILADEPVGNLDSENAKNVLSLLNEINKKDGKTIIMVTHQPWSLLYVDRIIYMRDGQIVREQRNVPYILETKVQKVGYGGQYFFRQIFRQLSPNEVYAKYLATMFLRGYPIEVVSRLEQIILQLIEKKIDYKTFVYKLDLPFKKGGVGLWRQKAVKIAKTIKELVQQRRKIREILRKLEDNPDDPLDVESEQIANWLTEGLILSLIRKEILKDAVASFLRGTITRDNFVKILDLPLEKGGVGLKITTALKIKEKLDEVWGI
jgi:putative ABC transport system ATP-binding protein